MNRRHLLAGAFAVPLLAPACTRGGQGDAPSLDSGFSSRTPVTYLTEDQVAAFARQVEADLSAREAKVAIVFRTGRTRDKLPSGISYTHGAFWARTPVKTADGASVNNPDGAYAVFNLYHGDGKALARTKSQLAQDFPADFVRGTAVDDFAVLLPSEEMQNGIVEAMGSPLYEKVHIAEYSLIANPLDARYQNCNEFMLDLICAILWKTDDYAAIKAKQKETFTPTPVGVQWYERIVGPMMDNRVRLEDQGEAIVTTTYESMSAFMREQGVLKADYKIERNKRGAADAVSATPAP